MILNERSSHQAATFRFFVKDLKKREFQIQTSCFIICIFHF